MSDRKTDTNSETTISTNSENPNNTNSTRPEDSFTYEDFDEGTVFRFITSIQDAYDQGQAERRLAKRASEVGFKDFKKLLRLFKDKLKPKIIPVKDELTDFEMPNGLELNTGEWTADSSGVWKYGAGPGNVVMACSHPIAPVQRIRSIDTRSIKYKIWYQRGIGPKRVEDTFLIDADSMASPTEIVKKMAPIGVSVTGGDRAKALVDYLRDVTDLSFDGIPEVKATSRMGWNTDGFSPYVSGVEFDSATAFGPIYKSITQVGSFDTWVNEAVAARKYSVTAKIVLAASFAAPLIEPLGILPFFVHLWSSASGTGKSVGQMLGASVWANPTPGGAFFPTFRSTAVGIEMMAGFLHSMPLFIDELQLAKDSKGNVKFNVYELASGSGKLRSNRSLGLNYIPKWDICFITSGETPIVKETDGEGALNRVLEIECYPGQSVIKDGHKTANILKANYGWAGRKFVEKLLEGVEVDSDTLIPGIKEKVSELYEEYYSQCINSDTTGKQAMAAAALLTADKLATDWIFHDGNALSLSEIGEYMKSKDRVSLMDRGYAILCDWVSMNANMMRGYGDDSKGEVYGLIEQNRAYIVRKAFNEICADNAIDPKALLSYMKSQGLIDCGPKGYTKQKRLGKDYPPTHCVCLKLDSDIDFDGAKNVDDLPF